MAASKCFEAFVRSLSRELQGLLSASLSQAIDRAQAQQQQALKQLTSFQQVKEAHEQARSALVAQRQQLQSVLDDLPLGEFWHCLEARLVESQLRKELTALDKAIAEEERQIAQAQSMLDVFGPLEEEAARRQAVLSEWLGRMGLGG